MLIGRAFGVFFLVAFGFRRAGISQEALSIVGGVLAYAFAAVVAILVPARRRRGGDAAVAPERFAAATPRWSSRSAGSLQVGRPEGEVLSAAAPRRT